MEKRKAPANAGAIQLNFLVDQETVTVTVAVAVLAPDFTVARTLQVPFLRPFKVAPTTWQTLSPEVTFNVTFAVEAIVKLLPLATVSALIVFPTFTLTPLIGASVVVVVVAGASVVVVAAAGRLTLETSARRFFAKVSAVLVSVA